MSELALNLRLVLSVTTVVHNKYSFLLRVRSQPRLSGTQLYFLASTDPGVSFVITAVFLLTLSSCTTGQGTAALAD